MSTHDHSKYTPGCFRCDLSRSEVQQAIREDLEPFSDSDLLDELARRGVLTEEWKSDSCAAPCPDASRWAGQRCLLPCDLERGHDEAHEHDECSEGRKHVWGRKADDGALLASYRHVTAWSEDDDMEAHNRAVLALATKGVIR